jgi:hypothetical protein
MGYPDKVVHLSAAVNVPASAGGFTVTGEGALFPFAEVSSVVLAGGGGAVDVAAVGSPDGGLTFTPAEARTFAAAVVAAADTAERGRP